MMNSEQSFRDLFSYHHSFEKKEGIYSDFFDSECYNRIASIYGGEDAVTWDIFIAASTDGFQAYKNRELAVWPVLAVLLNHEPSRRYSVKQILPLMFIPGGTQPTNLQSFLTPMINEINSTLPDGFPMKAFDGIERNVRLHLVWFTTDLDALTKVASLVGHNGKTPCRFCLIQGVYSSSSRHYYFPCSLLTQRSTTPTVRFDPASLPKRSGDSITIAIQEAVTASTLAERTSLAKETGIKGDSILFNVPTMLPYHSFPPDIMHLFCNVQKHLLNIHTGGHDDLFSLSVKDVEVLDDEILAFSGGISGQMAPSPRKLSSFHNWKAAEHKVFSLSYYLILFDGYLPQRYLDGLDMFVQIADISFRPELTETDISDLSMASTEFIKHFEKFYMRFDPSRLKFSTYVMHLLLHLAEAIQENGPLVNCSQYWVERYIGWIVDRLNAKRLPASSLRNNVILLESDKILFASTPTVIDEDDTTCVSDGFKLLGTAKRVLLHLEDDENFLRSLLSNYLMRKYDGMDLREAKNIVKEINEYVSWPKVRFRSDGSDRIDTASVASFKNRVRPSNFVAVVMDRTDTSADVYYGTLMRLFEFEICITDVQLASKFEECSGLHRVAMIGWAKRMVKGKQYQVYGRGPRESIFSSPTIEDVSVISRLIGVVEHSVPSASQQRRERGQRGQLRTYFIDFAARSSHLLDPERSSIDGINYNLKGFGRSSQR